MTNMRFTGNRNVFANYRQDENCLTNGLFSILEFVAVEDAAFPKRFIKDLLDIPIAEPIESFKFLRGENAKAKGKRAIDERVTVDGEIIAPNVYIAVETKITRGYGLTEEQVRRHLETAISLRSEGTKKLVLLTPDDGTSTRIRGFLKIASAGVMAHLAWKDVYDYLDKYRANLNRGVLRKLIDEYLDRINKTIIEQDFVGVLQKVRYDTEKSITDYEKMLNKGDIVKELKKDVGWRLPNERLGLDGKGKKLLISEPGTRAIIYEAEIREGGADKRKDNPRKFPYSYYIKPCSIMEYDQPIKLARIQQCKGLEHFGTTRSAYINLRSYQYEQLTKGINKRQV
ncbi:MAG: hypothetical protein WCA89_01125 [Terracidiphilus sp.]